MASMGARNNALKLRQGPILLKFMRVCWGMGASEQLSMFTRARSQTVSCASSGNGAMRYQPLLTTPLHW